MSKVTPHHYKLHLEPDLTAFRFDARLAIDLEAHGACDEIVLDMIELAIWDCRLGEGDQSVACPFKVDPRKEELRVQLHDDAIVTGCFAPSLA